MLVREVAVGDAQALCAIYNHYIEKTTVTFEERSLNTRVFAERIARVSIAYPWLVIEDADALLGYAYAREWKSRSAFRYTVESSIYLHPGVAKRKGTGETLYRALLSRLAHHKFHRVIAAITIPNEPSIALHTKLGFNEAGHFHQVGYKFKRWIDVSYMELQLEGSSNHP